MPQLGPHMKYDKKKQCIPGLEKIGCDRILIATLERHYSLWFLPV